MKRTLAFLGLLALGGCGSLQDLTTCPHIYGGVRQGYRWALSSCLEIPMPCDLPLSAVVDTLLLPITVPAELLR